MEVSPQVQSSLDHVRGTDAVVHINLRRELRQRFLVVPGIQGLGWDRRSLILDDSAGHNQ